MIYLGGHLNTNLLFKLHIKIKCKAAMINIIRTHSIQECFTKDTYHTLILSLPISHLDYSNSLLMVLPKKSINQMQHVQNTAAKLILNRHTKECATQCLKDLHQLPIQQRIDHKICTIVFKAQHKKAPNICRTNKY